MNERDFIIDVTPVAHSSSRYSATNSGSHADSSARNASRRNHAGQSTNAGYRGPYAGMPYPGDARAAAATRSLGSVMGGFVQMAAGAGLVLIGIPMLMLPGPGLLTIAAGALLGANGARKVFG